MKCHKFWKLAAKWRGYSPSLLVVALFVCVGVSMTNTPMLGAAATGVGLSSWENDLSPITSADWDYDKAAHLLERTGFGGTPDEIERLRFIQRLKQMGLRLAEIKELSAIYGLAGSTHDMLLHLEELLRRHLAEVEGRMEALSGLRDELHRYRDRVGARIQAARTGG